MKKSIQHLLSYSLLTACLTSTQASIFSDVPDSHWASPYVSQAQQSNLVSGVGENKFAPDMTMNYGQFSVIICNGVYEGNMSPLPEDIHWASGYYRQLEQENLFEIDGINMTSQADNFLDAPITREVVAVVLSNLLMAQGFEPGDLSLVAQFADVSTGSLSTGEKQSIANMVEHGIMTGDDSGKFGMGASLTRAQASVIIKNMLDLGVLSPLNSETSQNTSVNVEERSEFDLDTLVDPILETAGLSGDTVVATTATHQITAGEVLHMMVSELDYLEQMSMYGMGDIPWDEEIEGVPFQETLLQNAVELSLIYQIIFEVAEKEGISLGKEFQQSIQDYLDSVLASVGGNPSYFQYLLWQAATTEELYVRQQEASQLYIQIQDHYFGEGGIYCPDDQAVLDYMEEESYYKVKHILIATMDEYGNPLSAQGKADALAKAQGILKDLQASNDLENFFHAQMLAYSEDPGSHSNPDGYLAYPGQMVAEFESASLLMEEYSISDIVESNFGYHIIYRLPLTPEASALADYVNELSLEMQEQWVAENPLSINDIGYQMDAEQFYANLTVLRGQIHSVLE